MDISLTLERSKIISSIRKYLDSCKFVEIFSPKLLSVLSDPVRGNKSEGISVNLENGISYLAQSDQNYKQMAVISGLEKVYEIGFYWRDNREGKTERHLNEFMCLDIEIKDVNSELELMNILENIIKNTLLENKPLNKDLKIYWPIPIVTYDEAVKILQDNNIGITWGEDIAYVREKELGKILRKEKGDLFFIHKYPSVVKKFYTEKYEDTRYTKTFDLIFCGWEICSGAVRQTDIKKIEKGIDELGLNKKDYAFYLDLFRNTPPKHGGFGFGIDRFIAILEGSLNIHDFYSKLWGGSLK